jgi:hypothetical protein
MLSYCSFANEWASPLKESLEYLLVSLYFSLKRVSLAEYFLVLRVLFLWLLQMVRCITGIALTACILRWATTRTKDNGRSVYFIWCFCWKWLSPSTVSELKVCVTLKLFTSAISLWTWFVITLCSKLRCIQLMLRILYNIWLWLLNLYDLDLYVDWFEILRGFTDYRVIRA